MNTIRKAKIVCTLGPASSSKEMIDKLIHAGMDVARLNYSHGTHEDRARMVKDLRKASARRERPIAVLADLQGPKIRTGKLEMGKPVRLFFGKRFTITTKTIVGNEAGVSTTFAALPASVRKGDRILLSDGDIALRVVSTSSNEVITQIENGGDLGENKGINLPGGEAEDSFVDAKGPAGPGLCAGDRRKLRGVEFCAQCGGCASGQGRDCAAR